MALSGGATWAGAALELIEAGQPVAIVTQVATDGSTPREAGVRMVVGAYNVFGTIGGGNLEYTAIDQARRLLAHKEKQFLQQDYALGPLLAQCCGGRVRLLLERLDGGSESWLAATQAAEQSGSRYVLSGMIAGDRLLRQVRLGWTDGGRAGIELRDVDGARAGWKSSWSGIVEHISPVSTQLYIFGAGHVGRALVEIVSALPFRLTFTDVRSDMIGHPGLRIDADPCKLAEAAPAGAFFLVMTHAHELDYSIVRTVLARGDAAFCGLIGSETKRVRFASRLKKDGLDASLLTCPIGVQAIRSKAPASIAVAVAADLLIRLEQLDYGA